jgi:hypothetical protein
MKITALILLGLSIGWHAREWALTHWRWSPVIRTDAQSATRTALWGIWIAALIAIIAA